MGDQGHATQHIDAEREFSFSDMISRLWACRALLVMLPVLACGIALAIIFANKAIDREIISYHVKLIGIENGAYPNGTAFSPNDLKSAAVLSSLSDKYEVPSSTLEAAISVSYDNPASAGIALKYQQRLGARNLAPAVIDSINTAYTDELAASVNSGLRVEVNNIRLGLPSDDARALALAIPATWNETFLKRHRVLANTQLSDSAISQIPESLSGTARLIVAGEHLGKIDYGLKLISEDNRLAGVSTSEGYTADDLQNLVGEFRAAYFDPLMAGGFSRADPIAIAQKQSLQRQVGDVQRQIDGLDQNITRLLGERPTSSTEFPSQGGALEQGALEAIISLVRRSTYVTYTQQLLDKRQHLVEQHSTAQSRLDAITFRDDSSEVALSSGLTAVAETRLEALASKYRDLFATAQQRLVETSGRFYSETSTATATSQSSIFEFQYLLISSALAALLIAMGYALLAPSVRSAIGKKQAKPTTPMRIVANG